MVQSIGAHIIIFRGHANLNDLGFTMHCRLIATSLSFLITCSTIAPAFGANSRESDESAALDSYVSEMKRLLQAKWHPKTDFSDVLLVTKVRLSLDGSGRVKQCEIVQPSKSKQEDRSVQKFLRSVKFAPVPNKAKQFELNLTMMTDGRKSMVASDNDSHTKSSQEETNVIKNTDGN